jgi:hypothetical protein
VAVAAGVQGIGDQFFAGAGLAGDEHRQPGMGGDFPDLRFDAYDLLAAAFLLGVLCFGSRALCPAVVGVFILILLMVMLFCIASEVTDKDPSRMTAK